MFLFTYLSISLRESVLTDLSVFIGLSYVFSYVYRRKFVFVFTYISVSLRMC